MSNIKFSNEEAHQLVMEVRRSSSYDYPKNLLTRDETKLCIQHVDQLAEVEEKHDMGELDYFFAKIKISADYNGLKYTLPGIGEQRYKELKVEKYPEPLSTLADIDAKTPKAKWWVIGAVALIFVIVSNKSDGAEAQSDYNHNVSTQTTEADTFLCIQQ